VVFFTIINRQNTTPSRRFEVFVCWVSGTATTASGHQQALLHPRVFLRQLCHGMVLLLARFRRARAGQTASQPVSQAVRPPVRPVVHSTICLAIYLPQRPAPPSSAYHIPNRRTAAGRTTRRLLFFFFFF
jgi:hypothetical protein